MLPLCYAAPVKFNSCILLKAVHLFVDNLSAASVKIIFDVVIKVDFLMG